LKPELKPPVETRVGTTRLQPLNLKRDYSLSKFAFKFNLRRYSEVVVLNRLDHPNIIKIFNIFFTPATTGPRRFDPETFKLVPVSIDLYIVCEIAEGGRAWQILPVTSSEQNLNPHCYSYLLYCA